MEHQDQDEHKPQRGNGSFSMMALMIVCCMAPVLFFLLIPVVGWTVGLAMGTMGFIAMIFVHQRMGHGGHR